MRTVYSVDRSDDNGCERKYANVAKPDMAQAVLEAFPRCGDLWALPDALEGYGSILMPKDGDDVVYVVRFVRSEA